MSFLSGVAGKKAELSLIIKAYDQTQQAASKAQENIKRLRMELVQLESAQAQARQSHQKSSMYEDLIIRKKKELAIATKAGSAVLLQNKEAADAAEKSYENLNSTVGMLYSSVKQMAVALAMPIAAGEAIAIKNAAWAIEMENLFRVTTGSMTASGWKWTQEFEKQVGISQTRARQMVGTFHIMLTSMGQMETQAMGMSKSLVKLGYDIASFYNVDVDVAFEKLQSGIVGLPRGLKTLGIVVTEEMTKQWALNNALIKTGESLTEQQKVWARYNVILQQTRKAQGDMYRTMTSPQNQMRIFKERAYELSIAFGKSVMPAFQKFMDIVIGIVKVLQSVPQPIKAVWMALGGLVVLFTTINFGLLRVINQIVQWSRTLNKASATAKFFGKTLLGVSKGLFYISILSAVVSALIPLYKSLTKTSKEYGDELDNVNARLKDNLLTERERFKLYKDRWELEQKIAKAQTKEYYETFRKQTPESGLRGGGQFGGSTRGLTPEEQFNADPYIKAAKDLGIATTSMDEARLALGERYLKYVKEGSAEIDNYTKEMARLEKVVSDPLIAGTKAAEEYKKQLDDVTVKYNAVIQGRKAVQWALEQKGFPLPETAVYAELQRMLKEQPTELENVRLALLSTIEARKDEATAIQQQQEELRKLNAAVDKINESAGWNAVDKIKEDYNQLTEAIRRVWDETANKGLSEAERNAIVVKKFGKDIKKFVEENSDAFRVHKDEFKGYTLEYLTAIANEYDTMELAGKNAKASVADAIKEAEKLSGHLSKVLDALDNMKQGTQDWISDFSTNLSIAAKEFQDSFSSGALADFMAGKATTESRRGKKTTRENPMQRELRENEEYWAKIQAGLQKSLDDYNKYYDQQKVLIEKHFREEKQKFTELATLETKRVELHAAAELAIKKIDEAVEAGLKGDALAKVVQEGRDALGDIWKEGMYNLEAGRVEALGNLQKFASDMVPILREIMAAKLEALGLSAEDRKVILDSYDKTFLGILIKKGQRLPEILKPELPNILHSLSSSFAEFFSETESGFSVGLVGAVDAFATSLEDVMEMTRWLESEGYEGIKNISGALQSIKPETMGKLGAGLGSMIFGGANKAGSMIGDLASTFLNIFPGIGKALGPVVSKIIPLVGGIFGGLFKTKAQKEADRMKKAVEAVTKSMSKFGKISEETAKAIATDMKTMSEHAAVSKNFDKVIEDVGVTQKNVNDLWKRSTEILTDYKKGLLGAGEATEVLGNSFSKMLEGAKALGTEGSNAMIAFMNSVRVSGLAVQEMTDYIDEQLGVTREGIVGAAQGVEMMILGTVTGLEDLLAEKAKIEEELADRLLRGYARRLKEKELRGVMEKISEAAKGFEGDMTRIGNIAAATFNAMIENGVSVRDAFASMESTFDAMEARYEVMGTTGSAAIDKLLEIRKVQKANEGLFDSIEGNNSAMKALYNVGADNQDIFNDAQGQMVAYFGRLKAAGLDENEALAMLVPTMETLLKIQKERGYEMSAEAQALIDRANAEGKIAEPAMTIIDAILAGFAKVIEALTGKVPDALSESARMWEKHYNINKDQIDKANDYVNNYKAANEAVATAALDTAAAIDEVPAALENASTQTAAAVGGISDALKSSRFAMSAPVDQINSVLEEMGGAVEDQTTSVSDLINRQFATVTEGVYGTVDAVADLIYKIGELRKVSEVPITTQVETTSPAESEPSISAQSGGTWKVNGREQVFRAHKGEVVNIYRPESRNNATPVTNDQPVPVIIQNTFQIDVRTIDSEGFEKVFQSKIVPLLQRYTKSEKALIHPNAIRKY